MTDLLRALKKTVEGSYVDGQPLHIADRRSSAIKFYAHPLTDHVTSCTTGVV